MLRDEDGSARDRAWPSCGNWEQNNEFWAYILSPF
jgi:hypothetical protein